MLLISPLMPVPHGFFPSVLWTIGGYLLMTRSHMCFEISRDNSKLGLHLLREDRETAPPGPTVPY